MSYPRRIRLPDTDRALAALLWSMDDAEGDGPRGHAYLFASGDEAQLWTFQHAPARTPAMVARLDRWQAANPPSPAEKLRRRCRWTEPGGAHSFHADLGAVERALRDRRLTIHSADGEPPPTFAEPFLRAPVKTAIEAALPGARWPEDLDASELRFAHGRPECVAEAEHAAVALARYGSEYEGSGQDRTAAVFLSTDAGATWTELPWTQHAVPKGQSCWPPETAQPRFEDGTLVLRWEDPWFDWEPGHAWKARWDAAEEHWRVTSTDCWPRGAADP